MICFGLSNGEPSSSLRDSEASSSFSNGEPSSSLRASDASSSFLSQDELGACMGRFARKRDVLRHLMQKNTKASRTKAPATAATPIPAFAPEDKALLCIIVGKGDAAVMLPLGAEFVLDGWAVNEVDRLVEIVVEKSERSVSWYSMYRGYAHIKSGPVTVVVDKASGLTRPGTTVEPYASG